MIMFVYVTIYNSICFFYLFFIFLIRTKYYCISRFQLAQLVKFLMVE